MPQPAIATTPTVDPIEPAGRLITATEAHAEFRVSRMTLTRWAERGVLTDYRTPAGHRRVDRSELIIVLRGGSIGTISDVPSGGDAA